LLLSPAAEPTLRNVEEDVSVVAVREEARVVVVLAQAGPTVLARIS
jgi:hypothetical protein